MSISTPDDTSIRRNIKDAFVRVIAGGETDVIDTLVHPNFVNGLPPGTPATHKPFAARHVHLFRLSDDGRALEHWAVRDDLGAMMQAGLLDDRHTDRPG